jgi:hypothetical protein
MNDAIKSFYNPILPRVARSTPLRAKLVGFSSRMVEPEEEDNVDEIDSERNCYSKVFPRIEDQIDTRWTAHIPITIRRWLNVNGKRRNVCETRLIRIAIESDFDRPFPQSHRFSLMDPLDDIFFHWTLNLTPFTYKSLAMQMKWVYPDNDKDAFKDTFRQFAALIQQCANNVLKNQTTYERFHSTNLRHSATMQINADDALATVTFQETINGYRTVDIISLDFIESPWSAVEHDVRNFTKEVMVT